jgi:tetratricopeptide (TPR) repeat protein
MKLSRPAGTYWWPRALSSAVFAAITFPAFAAPPAPTREAKSAKVEARRKDAGTTPAIKPVAKAPVPPGPPEFADAYPSEIRPTPPDLLLKSEEERKAEAFNYFAQGLLAEDAADADRMLEGYRKTLEYDPGYTELAVKVGVDLARRGDPSAGIQILKDAVKAAPKDALPNIYLAQLYARFLKKPDLAEKYAQDAVTLEPENFAAYLALYELHSGTGDTKKAEQVIERAAKVNSKDAKYWVQLGNLYRRLYLKEDGTCGPEELKKMNAVHLKAAELGKTDAGILTDVGDYFVLSKQVKDAIPFYLAVLDLPQEAGDPQVVNVRDKLARSFIITGQRDEAIGVLEKLTRDNALRFESYELLAKLYEERSDEERKSGETAKADASLQRALDNYQHSLLLDASEPRNHLRLADLMMRMKQFDKAVETMQAAKVKFPDVPYIKYSLAIAQSQAKRHYEALATFAEAQADAENSQEEMLNADFYFSYGAAAEQAGLTDKAADLLKQSIQLEPNSAKALNYLGYMWADRGENLDEAGQFIKKANELDPDNGAYLDSLGWYYFKKGDSERALKELLRAAENIRREEKKDDPVVLDHIGDAYAQLGKVTEALDYWKKAVALGIEDPKVAGKTAEKIEEAKQKLARGEAAAAGPAATIPEKN